MRSGSFCSCLVILVGCTAERPAESPSAVSAGHIAPAPAGSTGQGSSIAGSAGQKPATASAGAGARANASGSAGSAGTQPGAQAGASGASGAAATAGEQAAGGAGASGAGAPAAGSSGSSPAPTGTTMPKAGPPQTSPLGYGRQTTGGGTARAVEVSTLAAMQDAIDNYSGSGGLVLKYTGKFDFGSISDPCTQHTRDAQKLEIKEKSDITILGADGSAANFGIHIKAASHNIIIRNMTLGLLPGGGDSDMISLEGQSGGFPDRVWIDHNELFSSTKKCEGAGDTAFDGMIDIKKGADHVTISYNYLHDHQKACLNGYSDSDSATRHVTFHHNVFDNIGSRTPLQRHGFAHLLNNSLSRITTSGINVRMGGYALIEANYFNEVKNPVTARDSDAVGFWELRANNLASAADVAAGNSFGITWDDGNDGTLNATEWKTTAAFPETLGYSYEPDSFECVRDGLRAVVGPGKGMATLDCK